MALFFFSPSSIGPRTNLKGWLFRVTHNLALKQGIERIIEGAWDAAFANHISDNRLNPEERLAERQRQRVLVGVLRLLPDPTNDASICALKACAIATSRRPWECRWATVAKSVVRAIAASRRRKGSNR